MGNSRLASFFPTLSFNRDFSRSNNINIDRASTKVPDHFIDGPDDITERWDANLRWDLGDLIYSSNQTSIDSREKQMVDLRHDLLAEATRIYYERRRVQVEIVFSPIPSERDHFERLLRMDELTSLLDAMSQGLFERQLRVIYANAPELARLWEYGSDQVAQRGGMAPAYAKIIQN